ncbi:hypothetical protein QC763_0088060 [Podospora pseudopauciseta]|uniref:Uncharacterized protein n=2 Tax=Podospora TaxID=5144 RepID=A0ABR0H3G3_9PEZI|nr:hypothetical protein QC763_0088060 [Podospora pseudopauciseta]KAK4670738.1 hypothetical protein QC764_0087990 [Podospora pseudoanserina]
MIKVPTTSPRAAEVLFPRSWPYLTYLGKDRWGRRKMDSTCLLGQSSHHGRQVGTTFLAQR